MTPRQTTVAIVGMALSLGGVVGVLIAVDQQDRRAAARYRSSPMPVAATHGRKVAAWVDHGLLKQAEGELDRGAPDTGPTERATPESADAGSNTGKITLAEQRAELYRLLAREQGLSDAELAQIRSIFEASPYMGQGNPDVAEHPMTREACQVRRRAGPTTSDDRAICGAPHMVTLFDPEHEDPARARVCMDQFEFPNVPCEYPVAWVRASEASRLCHVLGKRLCDAHEWEGACAGKILPAAAEYENYVPRLDAEYFHNRSRQHVWATRQPPDGKICATGGQKSPGCVDASWERCGTNSYPAGAFPYCVSPFGVYDLHGNVAEHMNLPLDPSQLGARGGIGATEMKGSWFAFDEYHPHPDDCRWRAPAWHATSIESESSHFNYHLGFRCCRDLD